MNVLGRELYIQARKEEKGFEIYKNEKHICFRQEIHAMPPVGWMNDPNGLCEYDGLYHMFFQYSPFDPEGGLKMWGHFISSDMVTWSYIYPALLPDQSYDCHGVYSGSALVEDGNMYLYYTGNVKIEDGRFEYDYVNNGRQANTVVAISEDGMRFEKKLLMTHEDYPEDISCHIRDPKVWRNGDMYYMVQGARTKDGIGQVLVFASDDKVSWHYKCRVTSEKYFGYMWECPDYFVLDGKKILAFCPQGLEDMVDSNVYQSGYFMIDGDILGEYKLSEFRLLDYGFDFYAPQTFETVDRRRILIGWMGMTDCDDYINPTVRDGWQHCMTFPRELFIKDGIIHQRPIKELDDKLCNAITVKDTFSIKDLSIFNIQISGTCDNDFKVVICKELILEYAEGRFQMKFTSTNQESLSAGRNIRYVQTPSVRDIRILADISSIEVYVNDGEFVFSTRYYPKCYDIFVEAKGATIEFSQIEYRKHK